MGLAAPWFLAGLAALAVPIYVHLLRQHKTTPLRFSSTMLFEHRTQSSVKHRRLKYFLLFAMRVATLVLLALTFANFFVSCSAPAGRTQALTVVAVDRSLSMKANDRIGAARAQALDIVRSVPGTAQVISFDSQASLLTQPTADKAALRAAVESIAAGDGRSSYAAMVRAASSIAKSVQGRVDVHLVSDIQKTSLPSSFTELALPQNVRLRVHPVATSQEPNWYVESVTAPRHVYRAEGVRVQVVIAGAGTKPAEWAVVLSLNGKPVETRRVNIPANGRTQVEFRLADLPHGFSRGLVQLQSRDALPQDDTFPFAIERKETGRVLFAGDPRSAMYYRTALESVPDVGLSVDQVSPGQVANLALEKYAVIVLTSPPPASENLARYLASGGGLLIALGPSSVSHGRVPVSGERILESRYAAREGERFQTAASVDLTHPALAAAGPFEDVKFYQTIRVEPGESRVLARLTDGTPLLLERQVASGRVLVFASTFDNVSNDLPLHAAFIPFVAGTARYLAGFDESAPDYLVGSYATLRAARESGTGVEVLGPDGRRELDLKEASTAQSFRFPREGFFEIRRASGRNELIAVHSDRRESDLTPIPSETLALWQNTGGDGTNGGAPDTVGDGRRSLWWYFAVALLAIASIESLLSGKYVAPQADRAVVRKAAA